MKNKATITKKTVEKSITEKDVDRLKSKFNKEELLVTALGFGHCVMLMYKAAGLAVPPEFLPKKEANRLVRALRKQGRDSV